MPWRFQRDGVFLWANRIAARRESSQPPAVASVGNPRGLSAWGTR